MFPVGERKPGRTPELPAADEDASTAATRIAAAVERMSVAFMVPPIRLRPSSAGAATQPSRGRNDLATAGRLGPVPAAGGQGFPGGRNHNQDAARRTRP